MPVLQPEKTKPQKKPQARGFHPDAMAQAQVLNQQPDSIPAMMKPGEYVLPPDTVAAMGGPQALDATVAQTHTPTNSGAIVPKGFEPRLFFSSGGLAQEEETKQVPTYAPAAPAPASTQTPRAQFVADQNAKLAAANARLAERTQEMNSRYQPALNSPANTFPGNRLPVESGAASVQPAGRGLPDPATGPSSFTGDVLRTAGQDAKAAWQRGGAEGVGAAAGALVRGSMATPGAIAYDAVDSVVNGPIGQGVGGFTRGLFGGAGQPPSSAAPTAPAQKSPTGSTGAAAPDRTPEQLAKQLGGLDRQHAQNVQLQAAGRTPEQSRAEVAEQPTSQQVPGLSGVYQHGRGQYSDNAQGMGFSPGRTGQPSAQNMQAADALASQQQAQSTARVQAAAQQQAVPQTRGFPGFEMPRQENAYERENRMRERNRIMSMLQTPLTGDPRRDLTASQRQQLVAQLGQESQERQATERNMFGLAGQHLNAETQRYSTDANTALGVERNSIDQQRVGMDGQRLGLDAKVRGFDVRAAQRRENAQKAWQQATPEQRSVMREQFPDLFGENSENLRNNFMAVGGGQEWDTTANVMRTVPQRLIDLRTMQEVGGGGVPRGLPQVGAVQDGYRFKGGNPSDRANWERV